LSRLIDDLLDVSRINLGKIELCRDVLDATPILDTAAQVAKTIVEERKHELDIAIDRGNLWELRRINVRRTVFAIYTAWLAICCN
jgi:signal transduction histidine kinase